MKRKNTRGSWGHWLLGAMAMTAVAACDAEDDAGAPTDTPRNDVEYIDALVPHHRAVIMMADEVIQRGESPEVRAMAQQMKAEQAAEIERMERLRAGLTSTEPPPETMSDPHMTADLAAMRKLDGSALDERFLRDMIPHHAGAVVLSHRALPNLRTSELRELAETTYTKQTREMNEMLDVLER